MLVRWLLIGSTLVAAPIAATAQSSQPNGNARPQATGPAAGMVVTASAETVGEPDPNLESAPADAEAAQPATPAKPRRAARVTTCRCGDSGQ